MSTQNLDISNEINRILSSNINDDLISNLSLNLLQSPNIKKSRLLQDNSPSLNLSHIKSLQKSFQIDQQDLFQKAQQVFKLKQQLQLQLSNISLIIEKNQKLTQDNQSLESENKKLKNQLKKLKESNQEKNDSLRKNQKQIAELRKIAEQQIIQIEKINKQKQIKKQKQQFYRVEQNQRFSLFLSKQIIQNDKVSSLQIFPQEACSIQLLPLILQEKKVSLSIQTDMSSFYQIQKKQKQILQIQQLSKIIQRLQSQIQLLKIQNLNLKIQIRIKNQQKNSAKNIQQKQKLQKDPKFSNCINCYTSIFLKSVQDSEQIDVKIQEYIRRHIFSNQSSFFQKLQSSQYKGKIVQGNKYGKATQIYQSGFSYQGFFLRNHRQGIGKLQYKDRVVYRGEWKKGKYNGKGIIYYDMNNQVQKIQGNFKQGNIDGFCTISFKSGQKVRSKYKNGVKIFSQPIQ